ncbi:hypothetical protein AXK11_04355 [Cephaloticoccus primus]|uniref:Lipopolysaccharide heptosyltransferase II n=1 Tax=Cephaloticoccus primus TaxID=1548207 RepID=A0A139SPZ8_9BACT|nr:glycosyltransferase family 9 protein [Cephaloticoccus primus]KXU36584.1 hypothetical protein AXK11_04355 [Cephaloticoccus primus]
MLKLLIQTTGWLVAHTPECVLRGATAVLAEAVLLLRRRLILSNLHHAFPDWSEPARRATARQSCRRMVETGLLSLATPFIPLHRLRQIVSNSDAMNALVASQQSTPRPHVLVTPHFAYWEAVTCFPVAVPNLNWKPREDTESPDAQTYDQREYAQKNGRMTAEFAAIYRPLKTPSLDAWLKRTRERYGIRLLSRKKGFQEAIAILRRGGAVSILFDQNAGDIGALSTLLGRVCSTTELPGLLAHKFAAPVVAVYAIRRAFWRIEVHAETVLPASGDASSESVTLALNRWLEEKLQTDANACASWLWAHARWKNQSAPDRRLRFTAKRNLLAADLAARHSGSATGQSTNAAESRPRPTAEPPATGPATNARADARAQQEGPRRTRFWVRLPNWLGDVVMLIPLLRALRHSRPDAELTLIGKPQFAPLIEDYALADRFVPLPPRHSAASGPAYFAAFWRLRQQYPDTLLLFTNSARGDIEAWLTRAPQRFGIARSGKPRPLLTHRFALPPDYDEAQHHQLDLWRDFLRHFGLEQPPDRRPLATAPRDQGTGTAPRIGLIVGSENSPEKRWPIPHWVTLIQSLPPELPITLFGTVKDRTLTSEIATRCQMGSPPRALENLAGKTDLPQYCARLRDCAALVTNDTGGMHLANALGVPLVALFGPTNPRRTGPVFDAPVTILQPPDCPPTGGGALASLSPAQVLSALTALLDGRATGGETAPSL